MKEERSGPGAKRREWPFRGGTVGKALPEHWVEQRSRIAHMSWQLPFATTMANAAGGLIDSYPNSAKGNKGGTEIRNSKPQRVHAALPQLRLRPGPYS